MYIYLTFQKNQINFQFFTKFGRPLKIEVNFIEFFNKFNMFYNSIDF